MKKLIVLLVTIGAVAAAVVFWRKNQQLVDSMQGSVTDTASSWAKSASGKAGKTADTVTEKTGAATDMVAAVADNATKATSNVADRVEDTAGSSP